MRIQRIKRTDPLIDRYSPLCVEEAGLVILWPDGRKPCARNPVFAVQHGADVKKGLTPELQLASLCQRGRVNGIDDFVDGSLPVRGGRVRRRHDLQFKQSSVRRFSIYPIEGNRILVNQKRTNDAAFKATIRTILGGAERLSHSF